ncbi:anthranilate phosphoribosyltransferase [Aquipuribacter nitratireducens]|uniref:Anthranilate phosphoribosyltransferase n=1 Tax=Aquipuribacter nitratireducens TaxID=650104 RepID=A0ABW0GRL2_9MICO
MSVPTWAGVLDTLARREDLDRDQTRWALNEVMSGEADAARLAGLLVGLRCKGETVSEVTGLAEAMLAHAVPLEVPGPVLDVVGTGGDGARTVNISTMAALVAAAAGATVVKHGNRAASSSCGTADVLEELGLDLELDPADVAASARVHGITFAFAARFHPAMRHVGPVRRSLGIRTVFNSLGPLTNPARPAAMMLGVADERHASIIAGVLAARGTTALVVRGDDGLDELTTTAPSSVRVVVGGEVAETRVEATAVGLPPATIADLRGGDRGMNAGVVRSVLGGQTGPVADVVVLNAAAGLLALDLVEGDRSAADVADQLPHHLEPALERARASLVDGRAQQVLHSWLG